MTMLQDMYDDLRTGFWANRNPNRCPCRGSGWYLSDLDIPFRCRLHGRGVPEPTDDGENSDGFDYQGHWLAVFRAAFADFREEAKRAGVRSNKGFLTLTKRKLRVLPEEATPQEWVDAAEEVAREWISRE